jgi:O-antigen/teichoic acid export membrane protein
MIAWAMVVGWGKGFGESENVPTIEGCARSSIKRFADLQRLPEAGFARIPGFARFSGLAREAALALDAPAFRFPDAIETPFPPFWPRTCAGEHPCTAASGCAVESRMSDQVSHRHRKLFGWMRALAGFGSMQLLVQAVGFLSGILVVRSLSKPDYAWFTIATSLAATMGILADSGVNAGLSAIGGRVWQDNACFGSLIRTALGLRRSLGMWSIALVAPFFIWMLWKNQAPMGVIAVLFAFAAVGFFAQITAGVYAVVISLRQEIARMQMIAVASALLRFAIIGGACLLIVDSRVAVAAATAASCLQVWLNYGRVRKSVDLNASVNSDYRSEIISVVKRQAPLTVFYCVQGQIMVWLISLFGSVERVAEIGALSRLSVIFSIFAPLVNGVVIPRFARCQNSEILKRRYAQLLIVSLMTVSTIVLLSAIWPKPLLWLLGKQYSGLMPDLWLMVLNAGFGSILGILSGLNGSKAWIAPAALSIAMEIGIQVLLILCFDISTVHGVLLIGCFSPLAPIALTIIIARRRLAALR